MNNLRSPCGDHRPDLATPQQTYTRRSVLASGLAAAACMTTAARAERRLVLNDASRLSPTPVFKHWQPKTEPRDAFIVGLRAELKEAAANGRPVAVGAARHSMGGQSLPRDGVAITLDGRSLTANAAAATYRVEAGARWGEVIRALDPLGFSPAVMQSNNDFGVASTFSVNAHGWPVPHGPFGSTVRSLRLMLADGSLVDCSRTENSELFSLAMGGYGLFGIIVDLEVEMARNALLAPRPEVMRGDEFAGRFVAAIEGDRSVEMAYGRLSVARRGFFDDALMVTYRPVAKPPAKLPPATGAGYLTGLSRDIYRAQVGSETAKRARWLAETRVNPEISSGIATRNSLLNEPVANLASTDRRRTDILHEYFIPPQRFREFLADCRKIIPPARAEFLNVTLRYVAADDTATLAFAPSPRIAAVMSFSQEISPEGEVDMIETTERLIDRAIAAGGAFYLPYRLHARRDQVESCYPKVTEFCARKRFYDPKLLFRNAMWDAYFA
jgi:FAD/FMN-containing dehydrogenase